MENYIKLLLVFELATMVNGRPPGETFLEANPMQLIAEAVGFYNGEPHSDVVFKLYKDEYEYKVGPLGEKQVNFTIKETLCQKSEDRTIESCEFKLEGLEKRCTASKNEQEKNFSVVCTSVAVGKTKKDPVGENVESPRNKEGDYADQPEDETSYEDYVITMDENAKIFLEEEDEEEKRILEDFLASETENSDDDPLTSRTTKRKLLPGQFLGRFLCLKCMFDIFPRK
ncbi:lutzicidin-like [Eleutherodactylus coqui]|uniref:lutzicidin-like n=1 Tax=Eleutherodactylus coqui TaxID=57060 RepID=UPI003461D329